MSAAGCWMADREDDLSTFDVLGALPTLDESRIIAAQAVQSLAYSPLGTGRNSGTGGSVESGLEQQAGYDSDQELEAIRGSVRSLRAQRLAVEQLKQKARQDERTSEVLRRKLIEAAEKIEELRAQGGRDVVRRLMDEVSELRARLKATSTAFQTREKSVAELREGMRELEHDRRAAQENIQAQAQKVGQQERESREQQVVIRRLEGACARCEERASMAERRLEEKRIDAGRELTSLSLQLRKTDAALKASKGGVEAAVGKYRSALDAARKGKESLLFQKGQAQEQINELTLLCEQQRSNLADTGRRTRDLERIASAAKKETKLAGEQMTELKARMSAANQKSKEDEARNAKQLMAVAGRAEKLEAELAQTRAEAAEKCCQLAKYREEMPKFREDVNRLREVAAKQGEMRRALRERDETIRVLRERLDLERRERGQWGQARKELLSQFCEEENKLRSTLQNRKQPQQQPQQRQWQRQQQQYFDGHASLPTEGDRDRLSVHEQPLRRHSMNYNDSGRADAAPLRESAASYAGREEKSGGDKDDMLLGLARSGRVATVRDADGGLRRSSEGVGDGTSATVGSVLREVGRDTGHRRKV